MARLEKLYKQVDNIKEQYFIRNRIAQENREKENEAAVRIQSWFRGCQTAYFIMKMNFYNKMAVKIQQRWRGYYVRKYVHNYYARKRYLEGLTRKNEHIRRDLEEFAELQRRERERITLEKEEKEKSIQAQRLHFLLSTKQGPFRPALEVQQQRHRPLEPSLRVATSITALEEAREELKRQEWRTCVIDQT
ncbi:hypothetical protein cypCar_00040077 [Cyprinus carpio]|nr:hypothetical protein cypCar_00040077 [Cyprinus carpio]